MNNIASLRDLHVLQLAMDLVDLVIGDRRTMPRIELEPRTTDAVLGHLPRRRPGHDRDPRSLPRARDHRAGDRHELSVAPAGECDRRLRGRGRCRCRGCKERAPVPKPKHIGVYRDLTVTNDGSHVSPRRLHSLGRLLRATPLSRRSWTDSNAKGATVRTSHNV